MIRRPVATCLTLMALLAFSRVTAIELKSAEPARGENRTADSMLGSKAGQMRDDNGLMMKLAWCPPGIFSMKPFAVRQISESRDGVVSQLNEVVELPAINVVLTHGYWIGKHETTQAEWKQIMGTEPWKQVQNRGKAGADYPVTCISCEEAAEFCRTLTEQERKTGRLPDDWQYALPTEAQWERACLAGADSLFSFGDDESNLDDFAWFDANAGSTNEPYPHVVGQKKPNAWGLHDMHGNVGEWCRDYYSPDLPGGRDPETIHPNVNKNRVIRGGWYYSKATNCRPTARLLAPSEFRNGEFGFRVALIPVPPAK